ncbi:MAG: two-component, nitrogen fixation regulatory protein [Phenylobacterium sp.]|nr:two-component, nitrogen fixation regulatory protein [Phenylobacterium sp.]
MMDGQALTAADPLIVQVIDDDLAICDALAELLGSVDLAVRTYASAPAFLKQLSPNLAGCVVTDIHMPEMSGLELLQQLRVSNPQLPVIVMSGGAGQAGRAEVLKAGAAAFLEKPFDDDVLLEAVWAALAGQAGAPA